MTIEQFAAYVLYQCKAEKTEARRSAYELVHHYLTQVTGAQGGHTKKDVKQLLTSRIELGVCKSRRRGEEVEVHLAHAQTYAHLRDVLSGAIIVALPSSKETVRQLSLWS